MKRRSVGHGMLGDRCDFQEGGEVLIGRSRSTAPTLRLQRRSGFRGLQCRSHLRLLGLRRRHGLAHGGEARARPLTLVVWQVCASNSPEQWSFKMSTTQWMLIRKRRLSRLWSAALAHWIVLEGRARPHLRRVRACERASRDIAQGSETPLSIYELSGGVSKACR
jgi:hypothetical protein